MVDSRAAIGTIQYNRGCSNRRGIFGTLFNWFLIINHGHSQLRKFLRLAFLRAEDIRMPLLAPVPSGQAKRRKWMRLPDAPLRKAEVEMLPDIPSIMRMIKVQPHHIAIIRVLWAREERDIRLRRGKAHPAGWEVVVVQQRSPRQPDCTVEQPDDKGGDHEAVELRPVSPACADVHHSKDVMCLAEKLVACCADTPGCAEDEQEGDQNHGDNAPDHVDLFNPLIADYGLGLVQAGFDDAPADGVQAGLHEDDVAEPAVQEVEVLVWNPREQGQQGLTAGEEDGEWGEGVSEDSNAVRPGT